MAATIDRIPESMHNPSPGPMDRGPFLSSTLLVVRPLCIEANIKSPDIMNRPTLYNNIA
jgi:hypothetical protein